MCGSKKHPGSRHHGHFALMPTASVYKRDQYPRLDEGLIYCLNCGQTFNSDKVKYCNNCGVEIQVCPISRNKFHTGDSFAQCPNCYTTFHYHHLTDWLENDNTCPYCRNRIDSILKGTIGSNFITKVE